MKRTILNTITGLLTAVTFMVAAPTVAFAQAFEEECPNPGPYGICVPETDIVIGNITIDEKVLALFLVLMFAGAVLMSVGFGLRAYTNRK